MDDIIIISIFMALEGVHAFSAFLPSVFTIKTFVSDQQGKDMIREGEIMSILFLLTLATATSFITKSKWPAILALVSGTGMVFVYEYALARSPANTGEYNQYVTDVEYEDCGCK